MTTRERRHASSRRRHVAGELTQDEAGRLALHLVAQRPLPVEDPRRRRSDRAMVQVV
jgi:hypothetical protein